jgi:hypothetical protein
MHADSNFEVKSAPQYVESCANQIKTTSSYALRQRCQELMISELHRIHNDVTKDIFLQFIRLEAFFL